jgi:serine/threonine protein phosphatase PrpC
MSSSPQRSHAALSDRGRSRASNEDAYAVQHQQGLYIVTDGVGGEGNGAAAARIVAKQLPMVMATSSLRGGSQFAVEAKKAISSAVRELHRQTRAEDGPGNTRATLVAIILHEDRGLVAHLGDSRAYLFRAGELTRLTKDHSFGQLLVDTGEMEPKDLEKSPYRSQITRCITAEMFYCFVPMGLRRCSLMRSSVERWQRCPMSHPRPSV